MSGMPPRCLTKLKRTPRMPPACRRASSASVTPGSTTQTPRIVPPERAMPSSVTVMSLPWQDACTITAREMPSVRCSFTSPSNGASGGV